MWSAFMNGSGLHGGGGAGGGYVPSQGWEFVPCARMERADRGRGKSRSPLRRISSPPTVFSHTYEPPFGATPVGEGAGEGGAGTQLEILRGQMWPGSEGHQQQQQTQHTRLKKKFEDLKKRHVQDKEEWLREKESLLREVADIQGGENRRILLDLKTVLEEVQAEVKREEEKRSELQLQYTRDRCAWELEKSELKCRIAQLEVRDGAGSVSGGVLAAGGPGSAASRSPRGPCGESSTLRWEREEQRRILADTQSAAMDLRCRLEHNERDWLKEKAELLERFEVERREWENQLKDMQKKIEELYCEVRVKRAGAMLGSGRPDDEDAARRISVRSTSAGSSLLSDNSRSEPLSSSSPSEPPGLGRNRSGSGDGSRGGRHSACFPAEGLCDFHIGSQFSEHLRPEHVDDVRSRDAWERKCFADSEDGVAMSGLDAALFGEDARRVSQECCYAATDSDNDVHVSPQESLLWARLSYSSDKKKNTTALNAALKEIARVSEELCSYQDEIRKKSGDKSRCEPMCGHEKTRLEAEEAACDLNQIYDDLRALGRENWITLSPDHTWQASRGPSESWATNTADPDGCTGAQISPRASEMDPAAPAVPPRSSSWNLSAPTQSETELHIPDSPVATVAKCHSPCVLVDRKCSSPSIVRKFEAMLQENEGKVLIDGVVASCSVPTNSNCNMGCCHNRWSCDASKFTNSKLSTYGTVQKSFSEVNIRSAGKDLISDYSPGVGNVKSGELQMPPFVRDIPVDLLLSSLEAVPLSSNLKGSKRNIMLEQKTAEFNRTLFQAEMGRGVEEVDGRAATDSYSVGYTSVLRASDEVLPPKGTRLQSYYTDVPSTLMDVPPELTLSLFVSDSPVESPELQPRWMRCATEVEGFQAKQAPSSVVPPEQLQAGLSEVTTSPQSPVLLCEVKHKASGPSRKTQHRAATEDLSYESVPPAMIQRSQSVDDSSSKREKPQPSKAGVPLQQLSTENKQRQTTQPRHSSDSSRPRMMNEHPWKPLTLAAYPRPEGSRSNYGAVERILKNYENAARQQQSKGQENQMPPSPKFGAKQEENFTELDRLSPATVRLTQTSMSAETHTAHVQLSSHSVTGAREIQLVVQEDEEPPVSSPGVQKNFSRPARPANRRLPSRWASRSPTLSSSTSSSSPSETPVVPATYPEQKHTSSFTYSHSFHLETVII